MKKTVPAPTVRHTWKPSRQMLPFISPYYTQDKVNELSALNDLTIRPIIADANLTENQVVRPELISKKSSNHLLLR